jgi:hypothetical protein
MARQHKSSATRKRIVAATIVALAVVIVLGRVDRPSGQLANLLGVVARDALELLPAIVSAAWQVPQALDHQWRSPCPLHVLVSLWPLVRIVAGAA